MPRLPNFIYIGPDKAGSSWLHEVLIRHEQVFMPDAKDLYFQYLPIRVLFPAAGHRTSLRRPRT